MRGDLAKIAVPPGDTAKVGEGGGGQDQTAEKPRANASLVRVLIELGEVRTSLKQNTSKGSAKSACSLDARVRTLIATSRKRTPPTHAAKGEGEGKCHCLALKGLVAGP